MIFITEPCQTNSCTDKANSFSPCTHINAHEIAQINLYTLKKTQNERWCQTLVPIPSTRLSDFTQQTIQQTFTASLLVSKNGVTAQSEEFHPNPQIFKRLNINNIKLPISVPRFLIKNQIAPFLYDNHLILNRLFRFINLGNLSFTLQPELCPGGT